MTMFLYKLLQVVITAGIIFLPIKLQKKGNFMHRTLWNTLSLLYEYDFWSIHLPDKKYNCTTDMLFLH